jgi:hypothetical protein
MQHDPGDTLFNNYVLEHGYLWATQHPLHKNFWDAPFYFPVSNTIAYSDNLLGSAPIFWAIRTLGFQPDTSFQLWMILVMVLNFIAMHWFLRQSFRLHPISNALGSFVFAFASSRLSQIVHAQLLPHFFTPLALLGVFKVFQEPNAAKRPKWLVLFFLSCIAQLYAGFYLGWFLGIGFMVAFVWAILLKETRPRLFEIIQTHWKSILLLSFLSLLMLWPLLIHSFRAIQVVHGRTVFTEPKVQSWIYLGDGSWLYQWQEKIRAFQVIDWPEQKIGIGLFTLVATLIGMAKTRHNPAIRIMIFTFLTLYFSMTSFYRKVLLWPWIYPIIPGANGVRALSRVGVAALVIAGVGIALYVENKIQKKTKGWIILFILGLCVLEQGRTAYSFDKQKHRDYFSQVATQIPQECKTFYFVRSNDPNDYYAQLAGMWASLDLEKRHHREIPTLNGFSGSSPPGWIPLTLETPELENWGKRWLENHGKSSEGFCLIRQ